MTAPVWRIAPGEDRTRAEIHGAYGGSRQNGISPSAQTPNVLVYSDHEKASQNGYDFDGWNADHSLFYYTGEGPVGDQQLTRGNQAIFEHKVRKLSLRLFVAVGNVPGTGTRVHRYVGQFEVDTQIPFIERVAPGADGAPRNVIVFRLRPVGAVAAGEHPHISTIEGAGQSAAVATITVDAVPVEAVIAQRSEVEKTVSGPVVQREAELTKRFQTYLEAHQRQVMRYRIVPVGSAALYSDLADVTANVLYEAKGSADRMSVRLALGQVLDYGRYVERSQLAVLLPEAPTADLVELLESHDVGCIVDKTSGNFVDMTALKRCP